MITEAELAVGLVIITQRGYKFALAAGFKPCAGDNVEHAIGAVTEIGAVAAAVYFEGVDVAGVDLRADVAGDVGVGDRTPSISQFSSWPPRMWSMSWVM